MKRESKNSQKQIQFYMSESDYKCLKSAADDCGLGLSPYVRSLVMSVLRNRGYGSSQGPELGNNIIS